MCAAADMPGLARITVIVLLVSCDAFRLSSSQHNIPFSWQDEGPLQPRIIQDLVRVKRHSIQDIVLAQPHLVHDMGRPEIHTKSRSQARRETSAGQDVERHYVTEDRNMEDVDEMERMVHLTVPQGTDGYSETEFLSGPGAGDMSLEASGLYGTDAEDRERGEDGGEDRERDGGKEREDEWERDGGEMAEKRRRDGRRGETDNGERREDGRFRAVRPLGLEANHTAPDLDVQIGYSPFFESVERSRASSSAEVRNLEPVEQKAASPALQLTTSQKGLLEVEGEEEEEQEGQSSGYGILLSLITAAATATTSASSVVGGDARGTLIPETDTGTDFALPDDYLKASRAKDRDEEEWGETHTEGGGKRLVGLLTTEASPTVALTDPSWHLLEKTTALQATGSEVRGGEVTEFVLPNGDPGDMQEAQQIVCVDWSELTGRGYVILNMTQNLNCEEFRIDQGVQLLRIMEQVFARRMTSPEGSWVLYISKPTHQQHQLLMNVASEHGVIATKELLGMLGEIRRSLNEVGIQDYSSAVSCQSRLTQTRSDYGKLFVVLVIIGSVCMVIITSGFIYICWQRRLPATKTTRFRAEDLHFVENGCVDNPTLDVTNDTQSEMQEKKPSTNGLKANGDGASEDNSRWQGFVNQGATEEEEEEQDTHL